MTRKISDWLLQHFTKAINPEGDKEVHLLEFKSGSTWNDGGSWNTAIMQVGDKITRVHMPSDYQSNNLDIDEMECILVPQYKVKK